MHDKGELIIKTIVLNEKKYEVISQKLIVGYCYETKQEMKDRQKKGLPIIPKYSYIAIKVKG